MPTCYTEHKVSPPKWFSKILIDYSMLNFLDMHLDEMTDNLNVLHMLLKYYMACNINDSFIVTMNIDDSGECFTAQPYISYKISSSLETYSYNDKFLIVLSNDLDCK